MEPIILIGGGGHCHSCIDVIEEQGLYEIIGIVDNNKSLNEKVMNYDVIGKDTDLPELVKRCNNFLITIGQIKTAEIRKKMYENLINLKANLPIICSPRAHVSKHSQIGAGTIVMHGAVINANCNVGTNCIINTMALCEHDVSIGNNCHISTAAIINGNCVVEDDVFVGSNSSTKQGVKINQGSVIPYGVKHG